jgi:hypothetical protein
MHVPCVMDPEFIFFMAGDSVLVRVSARPGHSCVHIPDIRDLLAGDGAIFFHWIHVQVLYTLRGALHAKFS